MIAYHFDWSVITRNADRLAGALLLGLGLAVVSLVIGSLIGLAAAYARVSGKPWLSAPVRIYVEFVRCTPLLLLIFFVYFGLPEFDVSFLDKTQSFVLTLSLYAGAYMSEVFRSGLTSIPRQYVEAAKAIGLRPWQRQRYVVLPVMFRITLPAQPVQRLDGAGDNHLEAAA